MSPLSCTLLVLTLLLVTPGQGEVSPTQQTIMDDTVAVWSQFRWGQTSGELLVIIYQSIKNVFYS